MLDYDQVVINFKNMVDNMTRDEYKAFMKKCGVELVDVEETDSDESANKSEDGKYHPGPFMQMYYDFYGINPEDEPPLEIESI